MKKTKIGVEIHKEGNINFQVLKAIGKHNGGSNVIDRETLTSYIIGQRIDYPSLYKELKVINSGDDQHISEDGGETFVLSLTWKEVEELEESKNDIPSAIFVTSPKEGE